MSEHKGISGGPALADSADFVLVETTGNVARIVINRPERRNALSWALLERIATIQREVQSDKKVRVIVVESRGSVFCSGHDLNELAAASREEGERMFELCTRVMLGFRRLSRPVIAKVQGLATAAGCQLVASCDLAVASTAASFETPGVKIGLFCTTPMVPLVRTIAPRAALEMLLTGSPITADRAFALGLVNRVVPPGALDEAVAELAETIARQSPKAIRLGKRAFYDQLGIGEEDAYAKAMTVMNENLASSHAREGIAAFLEKRPAVWPEG